MRSGITQSLKHTPESKRKISQYTPYSESDPASICKIIDLVPSSWKSFPTKKR